MPALAPRQRPVGRSNCPQAARAASHRVEGRALPPAPGSGTWRLPVWCFRVPAGIEAAAVALEVFARCGGNYRAPPCWWRAASFPPTWSAPPARSQAPGVIRRPYLPESEFWLAAAAVDACINLRYPAAGETSGIAIRLMGIGKPVLVTDSPEMRAVSPRTPACASRRAWPSGSPCGSTCFANIDVLRRLAPSASGEPGTFAARHRVELAGRAVLGIVVRVLCLIAAVCAALLRSGRAGPAGGS